MYIEIKKAIIKSEGEFKMKKNVYCVFDVEAIGIEEKFIYDIGMSIITKKSDVLFSDSWVVEEIFNNDTLMKKAYFGSKKQSHYLPKVANNELKLHSFMSMRSDFNYIISNFGVTHICAYNILYDKSAIGQTMEYLGIKDKFLQKPLEFFDIWEGACRSIFLQKSYQKMATKNGWVSSAGNFRTNAEVAFRYIKNEPDFTESHTALEDSLIESEILKAVLRQKKKITRNSIHYHPWRIPNKR